MLRFRAPDLGLQFVINFFGMLGVNGLKKIIFIT